MNDAAQIRRCNAALRANHSLFRPPPDARRPNLKISNREPLRLETAVTQTKQTIPISSNREKEAWVFGPHRGGSFLSDPPTFRPRFCRRVRPAKVPPLQRQNGQVNFGAEEKRIRDRWFLF